MKIKINFGKGDKEVKKEFSLDFNSIAKKVATSAANVAKKVETFIENTEETANEMYENAENDTSNAKEPIEDIFEDVGNWGSETEEQFSENKDDITRKAEEHAQKIIEKADNILKKAEERADQVIAKVDGFVKQVEDHLIKKVFEKDDSDKTDKNDSVSGEGKSNSEKDIHFEETPGDGDDYANEADEKENAKIALEKKISQIPEGKTFTLAEYFDYTEEYKCIGTMKPHYDMAMEFLRAISFPCTGNTITAFAKMITIEKLSYKRLVYAMSGYYNEGMIGYLKKNFETWLDGRPDVKKYCPNANLWQLLLYFRKKVSEAN